MKRENDTHKYLPLSEATTYIMLALVTPLHGYGIMQQVESLSEGTVTLGPGTLYGVLTSLEKERLIIKVPGRGAPQSLRPHPGWFVRSARPGRSFGHHGTYGSKFIEINNNKWEGNNKWTQYCVNIIGFGPGRMRRKRPG